MGISSIGCATKERTKTEHLNTCTEQTLFPNRDHPLHLVDKELAGGESFRAMGRYHFHPEGGLIDLHHSDAMDQSQRFDRPAFFDLLKNESKLMLGHPLERLVLDGCYGGAFLRASHHSEEVDHCSHGL